MLVFARDLMLYRFCPFPYIIDVASCVRIAAYIIMRFIHLFVSICLSESLDCSASMIRITESDLNPTCLVRPYSLSKDIFQYVIFPLRSRSNRQDIIHCRVIHSTGGVI